ncbi:hypothetical protein DTO164E3_2480 [Paecilomyces variotii]|nr:hypothetical protein DTO164E3_2480 [Paecilomyces variotii]KAJ9206900.1 hypothetical protein DTO032I3_1488 [Paecilomyces variotii]KAJ9226368.1 hypothetical protein DTO169C6_1096 [Paecilomyces variotii]KAJ9255351.1 hypothetical protein DTO207G8_3107 [Paecilomyces variotii]KAJ9281413.1 hypothetical protein DTO021D3_1636 [Paecilomyces variotii]
MDHSMHHAGMDMDHGHMGHGDMDMGGKCNMNMLFTWSTKDLCIIFPQWHITGAFSLLVSLVAIVLLTAGYEGLREATRRYEASHAQRLKAFSAPINPADDEIADESGIIPPPVPVAGANLNGGRNETRSLLVGWDSKRAAEQRGKLTMAALYAVQVFYSFFIMLLFMTYNGFVMLAVAVGAFVGYLTFGGAAPAAKSVACH